MILNKDRFNWYGLNHEKMRELYGDLNGDLQYVGTFTLENDNLAFAIYHAPKPDTSKGHKEFVMLYSDPNTHSYFITGRTREQIEPYLQQQGVQCLLCHEVMYSVIRHDYRECNCGMTIVDGGRAYLRTTASAKIVMIDFFKNTVMSYVSKR